MQNQNKPNEQTTTRTTTQFADGFSINCSMWTWNQKETVAGTQMT